MEIVVICGPYRSKTEIGLEDNIRNAERAAMHFWEKGYAVICPHKNSAHLGGLCDDRVFLDAGLEFVKLSDIVCMVKGWSYSEGARAELKLAEELNKEIIFMADAEDE